LSPLIENCKNLVIKVEGKVLTGTVDIWRCENIDLDVSLQVFMCTAKENNAMECMDGLL